MKQAPPVKTKAELIPGKEYYLSELPNGIRFMWKEQEYETITYPQYNVANLRQTRRPCFNLALLEAESLLYGDRVKVL